VEDGYKTIIMMHDHIKLLEGRIIFLAEYISEIDAQTSDDKFNVIEKFDLLNKRYSLQTELNHKNYLLKQYEEDANRQKNEVAEALKIVNKEIHGVIRKLKEKKGLDIMHQSIRKKILERYAKKSWSMPERKINDFNMANKCIAFKPPE